MNVEISQGWAEADRAASRYQSVETLRAQGAEVWLRFLADPIRYMGADPLEFRAAVLGALVDTAPGFHRETRVAVFTHGMPINIVLSHALGLVGITHFLVGYGSITRIRLRETGAFGVASVNETGHLRETVTGETL
jgi:probable phosphoglycerate mutase